MEPAEAARHAPSSLEESSPERALPTPLDNVEAPVPSATIMLTSGRRYDVEAGAEADRLVIRSQAGDVVLRIEVTDGGPVLSFSGASLDLTASQRLRLAAPEITVEATGDVSLAVGGSLRETVGGDHHTNVAGDERVEATNVQLQAAERGRRRRAGHGAHRARRRAHRVERRSTAEAVRLVDDRASA